MEVLSVQGLCKRYPRFCLDHVSFSLEQGKIMGFIGRNGAGKTTTLKALLNLVHPDAGDIRFFGLPWAGHEKEIKPRIGFVSGGVDYYSKKKLKVITDVTRRFYPAWDETAYRHYLSRFALEEEKTPDQLSAGMRIKYALALALSHRAELLILDEPTSGLDPVSRDDLLDALLALSREGVSILFSTHIITDLEKCADDITYIQRGQIQASEPLSAFAARYSLLALDAPDDDVRPLLLGCKPAKRGYTALIRREDAARLGLPAREATLEEIMIHLEKERESHENAAV